MKYYNYLLVSIFIFSYACTECEETQLTGETQEWLEYYKNNDFAVFSSNGNYDTLYIQNRYEEDGDYSTNCGDCLCETIVFDFDLNKYSFTLAASHRQKLFFVLIRKNGFSIGPSYYVNDNTFDSDGYYNPFFEEYSYKGSSYDAIVIDCIKCNEVPIKKLVFTKELGILEYIDKEGNVWVKQL